jgi:hypothetical protein
MRVQVLPPGKLKTNRIKSNRSTKSHLEKFLCYHLESEFWIGLGLLAQFVNIKKCSLIIDQLIRNACWNFFYTDKLMGFNPLRYSIWLGLHSEKIPDSASEYSPQTRRERWTPVFSCLLFRNHKCFRIGSAKQENSDKQSDMTMDMYRLW